MLENVPWYVGGGAIHPAAAARNVYFEATGGTNGVGGGDDFKVTQTPTASNQVRIAAGSGTLRSRYPGAFRESYACRGSSVTDVPVPATGSTAGATSYLIIRIDDPNFAGQITPPSVPNGPYVRPVLVSTDPGLRGELLPYPNIPLAKIVQPINTATITNAMITDLRRIAQPNSLDGSVMLFRSTDLNMTKGSYTSWPHSGSITDVEVPEWATHIQIKAIISGIEIIGTAQAGGVRTAFGGVGNTQNSVVSGDAGRQTVSVMGEHLIAANQRSTLQSIAIQGNHTVGTGSIQSDYQTNMDISWVFLQKPV